MLQPLTSDDPRIYDINNYHYNETYNNADTDDYDYVNLSDCIIEYQPPAPMLMGYDEYRRHFISK